MLHRTQRTTDPFGEIKNLPDEAAFDLQFPTLPEPLLQLSAKSMTGLRGAMVSPRPVNLPEMGIEDGDFEDTLDLAHIQKVGPLNRIPIQPAKDTIPIVACDASSVKVGETETGMLFAIRAVAVWRRMEKVQFRRWGPLLFHVPNSDGQGDTGQPDDGAPRAFGGLSVKTLRILTRLRNHVERWVQEALCTTVHHGIVLFDGSLTAGTPDNPAGRLSKILSTARSNNSIVIALSKSTQLTVGGRNILTLFDGERNAHLTDITEIVEQEYPAYPIRFLGRVGVVKLTQDGFLFRVDIDKDTTTEQGLLSLGRVAGTDVAFHGYPESLRIAHIFSTFTSNEILAIQRFITTNHGISLQSRPSLRRSLFGPFGTSRYVV